MQTTSRAARTASSVVVTVASAVTAAVMAATSPWASSTRSARSGAVVVDGLRRRKVAPWARMPAVVVWPVADADRRILYLAEGFLYFRRSRPVVAPWLRGSGRGVETGPARPAQHVEVVGQDADRHHAPGPDRQDVHAEQADPSPAGRQHAE